MVRLYEVLKNFIQMLPWFKPSRVIKRKARKEVSREEHTGGMDAVRKSVADSQRREE